MMARDWYTSYLANLDARDESEAQHRLYIDAYTRLADRLATTRRSEVISPSTAAADQAPIATTAAAARPAASHPPGSGSDGSSLQTQLQAANTARASLAKQQTTLQAKHATLQSAHQEALSAARALRRHISVLETRVSDRDEELRSKAKLVEAVQNDMVALTLALNLAEDKVRVTDEEMSAVRKENEELVARWLRRVGDEAEMAGISSRTDFRGQRRQ